MRKRFDIGILGGGQLGRMLVQQAQAWGLRTKVLDPSEDAPCAQVADAFLCGSLQDPATLRAMAEDCSALTIEIEQVNAEALEELAAEGHRILPSPKHVARLQDKGLQKEFLKKVGLPTAPFALLHAPQEVIEHPHLFPAVCKLRKAGYDGRGVLMLSGMKKAPKEVFSAPAYIEARVDIRKELAVLVARNQEGEMRHYAPVEMVFHKANVLDYLVSPADVPPRIEAQAIRLAEQAAEALDYVGVLAVELFWTKDDKVWVNEMAPRVHNSAHHTRESHDSSQFGQLIRILQGWPLGSTNPRAAAALINILGPKEGVGVPQYEGLSEILARAGCYVYLYGKKESRPYRKMGHLTLIAQDRKTLQAHIRFVQATLGVQIKAS